MLLTISTTHLPATDLGYLLHKHPGRCQSFDLSFGRAHVVYPVAHEQRCTAALLLDVDPVAMVRTRRGPAGEGGSLGTYVNDRPYVASSFMSVAIAQVYGTALAGTCKAMPELVKQALPLEACVAAISCWAGNGLLRDLFEPLGYAVEFQHSTLDERFPEWGESPYFMLTLRATKTLSDLLSHLYVLIPVLDNDKHYWVGRDEVDKLLRQGEGWLDLGCGEAKLLRAMMREKQFERIVGMDVSVRALEIAARRLKMDEWSDRQRERVSLLHGSLMYRDARLVGFDAATVVEVIEHLDPPRLRAFERTVFEFARPRCAIITTPNVEYNSMWPTLPAGAFRHRDHRFEWTRREFQDWSNAIAQRFGYRVTFEPIGPEDETRGSPTQMAAFEL